MINLFILCIDEIPCYILRPHWKYVIDPTVQRKFRKKMKKWHPGPLWDWLLHGILGFIFVSTLLILVVLIDTYKLTIKKINLNFVWLTFSPQALECIFVLVFSRKFRLRDFGIQKIYSWGSPLSNFCRILPGLHRQTYNPHM